jgi:hypothetical protein
VAVRGADHRTWPAADHPRNQSISHPPIIGERACLHADTPRIAHITRTFAAVGASRIVAVTAA